MKKYIPLLFSILGVSIFFFSCKKDSLDNTAISTSNETIRIKVAPNQSYLMDLSNAGTVSISRQAMHFALSETIANSEIGTLIYKYIPAADFTGNDEVVLLSTKTESNNTISNGGGCPGSSNAINAPPGTRYTTIKITVGN